MRIINQTTDLSVSICLMSQITLVLMVCTTGAEVHKQTKLVENNGTVQLQKILTCNKAAGEKSHFEYPMKYMKFPIRQMCCNEQTDHSCTRTRDI